MQYVHPLGRCLHTGRSLSMSLYSLQILQFAPECSAVLSQPHWQMPLPSVTVPIAGVSQASL